jgi:hypothetical protein
MLLQTYTSVCVREGGYRQLLVVQRILFYQILLLLCVSNALISINMNLPYSRKNIITKKATNNVIKLNKTKYKIYVFMIF